MGSIGSIIIFIIIGIIAGYVGRALYPGDQSMSFGKTALVGMAGSLLGGVLGSLIFNGDLAINAAGIIGSIIGTLIVIFILIRMGKA